MSRTATSVVPTWTAWASGVALPVALGIAVYAVARPRPPRFLAPISVAVETGGLPPMPEWLVSTLPDGLWTFAMTMALLLVWRGAWTRASVGWVLAALGAALAHEGGQRMGLLAGTFDWGDVLAEIVGWIAALATAWRAPSRRRVVA